MTVQSLELAHLPSSCPIFISLYHNVENAAFLRRQLLEGNKEFEYAFLDASMILSEKHISAAIFRAINDWQLGRLKSRNVHSEIVFSLSVNNNIAESFRRFGIGDDTKSLLVIKVGTEPSVTASSVEKHLSEVVRGDRMDFSEENLKKFRDLDRLRKVYKLDEATKKPGSQGKKNRQSSSNDLTREVTDLLQDIPEMEAVVLGSMALKGW